MKLKTVGIMSLACTAAAILTITSAPALSERAVTEANIKGQVLGGLDSLG
jgi:hypothetical protein